MVHGPQRAQPSSVPGLAAVSTQAQKLADQASVRSLEAIRKAREAIRARLADYDRKTTRPGTERDARYSR